MTSRERIRAAINHQQPDRVPVDFGGTFETGIAVGTVYNLRQVYGLDSPDERVKVIEPYQMLGEIKDDLREKMYVDTTCIYNPLNAFGFANKDWKPWTTFDGAKVLVPGLFNTESDKHGNIYMYPQGDRSVPPSAVMPKGGFYFDSIIRQHPIDDNNLNVEDNLEEFGPYSEETLDHLRKQSEYLYNNTDRAIVYGFTGASFGDVANTTAPELKDPKGIRDTSEWYMSFSMRKNYIYDVFAGECEIAMKNLAKVKEAAGNHIDVIKITGADYGSQRGPLLSPVFYREMIKPFNKRMCDWIHQNTTWKVFMHCCGGIRPLLDDIIDAGFDIISPVQTSAAGMESQGLKEDFGDRITFWGGGVETQSTLPFGTPEEVYNEVTGRIRIFNKGGGFVFNAVHNIQPYTPVKNIVAMIEAIRDTFE
ncbi:uroporphyrinogen decarboxylase family protein [Candidatus Latescibacterota bacterium]